MGFIPLFITLGAACLLFYLTVRKTMLRKIDLQRELLATLNQDYPELGLTLGELYHPDIVLDRLKKLKLEQKNLENPLELIRQLKINKFQYNALIKKAPYNWVAALSRYQEI